MEATILNTKNVNTKNEEKKPENKNIENTIRKEENELSDEDKRLLKRWERNRGAWYNQATLFLMFHEDIKNDKEVSKVLEDINFEKIAPKDLSLKDAFRLYDAVESAQAKNVVNGIESSKYYNINTVGRLIDSSNEKSLNEMATSRESIYHRHLLYEFDRRHEEFEKWHLYGKFSNLLNDEVHGDEKEFDEIAKKDNIKKRDWEDLYLLLMGKVRETENFGGAPSVMKPPLTEEGPESLIKPPVEGIENKATESNSMILKPSVTEKMPENTPSEKQGEKASFDKGIKEGEKIMKILNNEIEAPPITIEPDNWQKVGRIKTSEREYTVENIHSQWQVVKVGDGVSILPIIEKDDKRYIVLEYKPQPSVRKWELELPSGGKSKDEDSETTARRELEEETGYKAANLELFMHDMHFFPPRLEQSEDVYIATGLTEGYKRLEYEEQPIKICVFPEEVVEVFLKQNKITDFRTVATLSQYFLREHEKENMKFMLRDH
ncbi:MAG: NUDIX domain-containing protein [Candidatus Micrarchaeaceae archaeon]